MRFDLSGNRRRYQFILSLIALWVNAGYLGLKSWPVLRYSVRGIRYLCIGLRAVDGDRTGERVNLERVKFGGEIGGGPLGPNLPTRGVGALEGDGVAGRDGETRGRRVVPTVAEGLGREGVVHGGGRCVLLVNHEGHEDHEGRGGKVEVEERKTGAVYQV